MTTLTLADSLTAATAAVVANGEALATLLQSVALREANAVLASGVAADASNPMELAAAMALGARFEAVAGGSVNALAVRLPAGITWPALLKDMEFLLPTLGANTAAVTVAVAGFAVPPATVANSGLPAGTLQLRNRLGGQLAAGDLSGRSVRVRYDGAGSLWLTGSVTSEATSITNALTIVKAAGSTFNYGVIEDGTRTDAGSSTAGLQVVVLQNVVLNKKSPTSNLVVGLNFSSFSPVNVGQGSGADTARLVTSVAGVYKDFSLNSAAYNNGVPSGSPANTPTCVLRGLPSGQIGLGMTYRRNDSYTWRTIFNPNNSDYGLPATQPVTTINFYEYEPNT